MPLPPGNGRLVPLGGALLGPLDAPPQLDQHPPQVPGVDAQAGLLFEHGGNPRKRPEIVGEAVGLRPFGEEFAQGHAVGFMDLGWLSKGATLPRLLAFGIKGAPPAQCRGRRDFALPGHLRLGDSTGQQRHALLTAGLHGVEVALRWPRIPNL